MATTKILDFRRSFTVFESDFEAHPPKTVSDLRQNVHNRARIQIDCHLRLTDPQGQSTDYYLSEACKTERVGADRQLGIFTQPNADFRVIMSEVDTLIVKSWAQQGKTVLLDPPSLGHQPERQLINTDSFWKHDFMLNPIDVEELPDPIDVVKAVDAGRPVLARTEYDSSGYGIVLDYPVTTINVSERHRSYQVDTGPVVYADFSRPVKQSPEAFSLAFAGFNSPDWIEFIVNRPTEIANGIAVNHYSEIVLVEGCRNSIFAVR